LLGKLRPLLQSGAWVLTIAAGLFVAFAAYLLRRRIVLPVHQLSAATQRVAEGDLAVRTSPSGGDELVTLAVNFNRMAESLERERSALLRATESLARSERLASVGRLAAGVAHEVGNPVAAILGYTELAVEELLAWKIHGVDGEFIEKLKDLGYTDLDAEKLVALRIHQVTPAFLKQMKDQGFPELTTEQALAFRIHGVDLDLIEDFRKLGYEDLSGEQLIAMRIHQVTPGFIEDLADLGYKDVPVDKLVAMRVHDITRDFIEKLHEEGRTDLTIDDMVRLKIHGKGI